VEPAVLEKDVAQNPSQTGNEKIVQSHCDGISSGGFEKRGNVLLNVTHTRIDNCGFSLQ
jgi:hypothetical protein